MESQIQSMYRIEESSGLKARLELLPIATEEKIKTETEKEINFKKAIVVNDNVVSVMSNRYKLIQHKEAFAPFANAMENHPEKIKSFSLWNNNKRANLAVYLGNVADNVQYGFKATNSFDGTVAVHYGMQAEQHRLVHELVEKTHVLVWTYRQICSNGATIAIPLKESKYLKIEQIDKIKKLAADSASVRHVGNALDKIKELDNLVEAFLELKLPLDAIINDAMNRVIYPLEMEETFRKYFGDRKVEKLIEVLEETSEPRTLWGMFNAVTWYSSHTLKMSDSVREKLNRNASKMLMETLGADNAF